MFNVKQKDLFFRILGILSEIFTINTIRYILKLNDTFRLINVNKKG